MGQLVFTFSSPKCIEETKIMINGAINRINGTVIKEKGNRGKCFNEHKSKYHYTSL